MADSKISALPASTTPLAGTEVLPIVQSSTTRQVSVANLTAGRAISATQLTLTTGNLIVASGQGVDFSATSSGSGTSTSELFSDYEEGTFTPQFRDDPTGNIASVGTATGNYTKIGNTLFYRIDLENINTTGLTALNGINITGLPFAVVSAKNKYFAVNVFLNGVASTTGSTSAIAIQATSVLELVNNITTGWSALLVSGVSSGTGDIFINGCYQTA